MQEQGKNIEEPMEDYLVKAVADGALPSFDEECLKVQAVIERTLYLVEGERELNEEKNKEKWGKEYESYKEKIKTAIKATAGEVLVYKGKEIYPLYHRISGGKTESAADAEGNPISYLQSVNSPGEETSPEYLQTKFIKEEELKQILLKGIPELKLQEDQALFDQIQILGRGLGERIKTINIGNKTLTGEELMQILQVHSSNIRFLQQDDNSIKIIVKGRGHGIGLSQYGAQVMEKLGKDYKSILKHYYSGIEILRRS